MTVLLFVDLSLNMNKKIEEKKWQKLKEKKSNRIESKTKRNRESNQMKIGISRGFEKRMHKSDRVGNQNRPKTEKQKNTRFN